jgi:hypothetical protein
VKKNKRYVLVDEDRWQIEAGDGRPAIPFLERDGHYYGPATRRRDRDPGAREAAGFGGRLRGLRVAGLLVARALRRVPPTPALAASNWRSGAGGRLTSYV